MSSTDVPAALDQAAETSIEARSRTGEWIETTLTVMFAAVAILLVSFLAVVTNLS